MPTASTDAAVIEGNNENGSVVPVGVHGVRLKRFERVVARLLSSGVEPFYVLLPPPPTATVPPEATGKSRDKGHNDGGGSDDWLFSSLPHSARVVGNHPNHKRAQKKEGQLRSMLRCILRLVPPSTASVKKRPITIVDFGGGSGHLGIPLALLLPHCRIIVVDFNERSIDLLHQKAACVIKELEESGCVDSRVQEQQPCETTTTTGDSSHSVVPPPILRCCGKSIGYQPLGNLFTFAGPVEGFVGEGFDVAIALHLCGQATDVCLRAAVLNAAAAIVVAPCCVGKLSAGAFNPDIYHATGQNDATVRYPQSALFCRLLGTDSGGNDGDNGENMRSGDDWNALAKAADYSNEQEFRTSRNASRRTAKALLETDRRLFLESHHYRTALTKMEPLEVTPKNDILVAWKPGAYEEGEGLNDPGAYFCTPDAECLADVCVAKSHLLGTHSPSPTALAPSGTAPPASSSGNTVGKFSKSVRNDWTEAEEEEVKNTIADFLVRTGKAGPDQRSGSHQHNEVLVFPTRMGGRKRKLIHYVAERMNLAHWGQGKKVSEKTVAVARRRKEAGKGIASV